MNNRGKRKIRREGAGKTIGRSFARILAVAAAIVFVCAGCHRLQNGGSDSKGAGQDLPGDDRLCVVTTIFPYYDFVRQIAGDRVKLKLVVPAGMDSHSFEPTPADMIAIQEADVLICNGGAMEQWLERVLESLDTSSMEILTMMDYVDVVEEEHVEGMEDAHDHAHDHENGEEHSHADGEAHDREAEEAHADGVVHDHEAEEAHDHGEEAFRAFDSHDGHEMDIEYDEHIWTSPVNAMAIVKIICGTLAEKAPSDAARFHSNTEFYLEELAQLDARFRQVVSQGRHQMIVVADKFPLRYFADEYGLSYRAAFSGCSTDTEPSARTIAYLIDKIKENDIGAVYYLELSSHRTADIIGEETGARPLLFHSCHNVARREFDEGVTYLQLMRRNVENLRLGLQ